MMHKVLWLHVSDIRPVAPMLEEYLNMYQQDHPEQRLVSVVLHRYSGSDGYMCIWGPR